MIGRTTYGNLTLSGGRWLLTDVPPHVALRLKSMFPRIAKTQTGTFEFPASEESSADLEWFCHRYAMDMTDGDRAALLEGRSLFERDRREAERILMPGWQAPSRAGLRSPYQLYHPQAQAVEVLRRKKRLLLGDDVGLGKTLVALGAVAGSEYLPAAIVVQTHLATQWVEKFIRPMTYMNAHIIKGTKPYSLPAANLYIFKYSNIAGWADVAAKGLFKSVFFDEVQELRRGNETEKGKAARVFADNAVLRCGMSATPVFNYGDEAFQIVEFLDPGALGTWEEFTREWCKRRTNLKWIVNDPEALGTYLREIQLFIRRLRQGRPINHIPIEVDYDEDVAQESADLARKLALKVMNGSFTESGQAARELDMFARHQTGMAKARSVAAHVRILLKSGTPVLLAGWHRDVYSVWLDELKDFRPVMYTGTESPRQKDRAKEAFIRGDTNLKIISLRSGAGLDGLQQRCSTVAIGELDWSPQIYEQLFGRVDRPGQKADEITALYYFTNSGSDPIIMSVNGVKRDQARGITDPGMGVQVVHTDESRIKALAQRYLDSAP